MFQAGDGFELWPQSYEFSFKAQRNRRKTDLKQCTQDSHVSKISVTSGKPSFPLLCLVLLLQNIRNVDARGLQNPNTILFRSDHRNLISSFSGEEILFMAEFCPCALPGTEDYNFGILWCTYRSDWLCCPQPEAMLRGCVIPANGSRHSKIFCCRSKRIAGDNIKLSCGVDGGEKEKSPVGLL